MEVWITPLKSVILVILVSEFLKELFLGESYKRYIQFAVSLFIFGFLLSSLLHTDFSLPDFPEDLSVTREENLLVEQYQTEIQAKIGELLLEHNLSYEEITVTLSPTYEIETICIKTQEEKTAVDAVLKGDFPYEVVGTAEN